MNKDQILNATDSTIEPVVISEWNDTCHVRTMDGYARGQFEFLCAGKAADMANARIMERLLVCAMCDEDGNRLFDGTEDDVMTLSKRSGAALAKLWRVAAPLNGIGKAAVEDAKGN